MYLFTLYGCVTFPLCGGLGGVFTCFFSGLMFYNFYLNNMCKGSMFCVCVCVCVLVSELVEHVCMVVSTECLAECVSVCVCVCVCVSQSNRSEMSREIGRAHV